MPISRWISHRSEVSRCLHDVTKNEYEKAGTWSIMIPKKERERERERDALSYPKLHHFIVPVLTSFGALCEDDGEVLEGYGRICLEGMLVMLVKSWCRAVSVRYAAVLCSGGRYGGASCW